MIPLPIAKFSMQYGTKILAGLLPTAIVWGGYLYWEHKQEKEGMAAERADRMDREAKINVKSEAIIELKRAEHDRDLKRYKEEYTNAIKEYVQYSQKLERDLADAANHRLFVRTKTNNKVCPDAGQGSGQVPQGNSARGQAPDWSELAEEDSRAIQVTALEAQQMANICAQAIGFIERHGLAE